MSAPTPSRSCRRSAPWCPLPALLAVGTVLTVSASVPHPVSAEGQRLRQGRIVRVHSAREFEVSFGAGRDVRARLWGVALPANEGPYSIHIVKQLEELKDRDKHLWFNRFEPRMSPASPGERPIAFKIALEDPRDKNYQHPSVNAQIIRNGWAWSYCPDSREYDDDQARAMQQKAGLWKQAPPSPPPGATNDLNQLLSGQRQCGGGNALPCE